MKLPSLLPLLLAAPALASSGTELPHLLAPSTDGWPVLEAEGEGWTAVGAAWRCVTADGRTTFTATPARDVETSASLGWSLESIRLGEREVPLHAGAGTPRTDGLRAVVERGDGVEEVVDVRDTGVELSYVFHALPAGDDGAEGDLVVRLAVDTTLPRPAAGTYPDGLVLEREGVAGVRVGAVTGLDAAGRAVAGSMRFDGEALELVLPAELLAHRAFPIVLDPLISILPDLNPFGDQRVPEVAYDASNEVYLVAWQRRYSSTDNDVYAQRFDSSGAPVGSPILLESSVQGDGRLPVVGNAGSSDRFLVVWQNTLFGQTDVRCISVKAGTGSKSFQVAVADTSASEVWPDVCSDPGGQSLVVVWEQAGAGIRGKRMEVPASGNPSAFGGTFTISTSANDGQPVISQGTAGTSDHLVVWERWYSTPAPGDHDLFYRFVNVAGVAFGGEAYLAGEVGPDEQDPDVDGNGSEWLVAYQKDSSFGALDSAIHATSVENGPFASGVREADVFVDDVPGFNDSEPSVAHTGEGYVLAYRSRSFADSSQAVRVRTVDGHCLDCGDAASLDGDFFNLGGLSVASQWSGSGTAGAGPDQALVVYETHDTAVAPGIVNGAVWETRTGSTTYLFADCGDGGIPDAPCANVGNANFTHRLSGAPPFVPVWLLVGLSELGIDCGGGFSGGGTCLLIPNVADSFVFAGGTTDFAGRAAVTTPLSPNPAFVGLTFTDQWVVQPGATGCALIGTDLSDALRVTLE